MNGKISIVVPIYNSSIFLPQCIESILNQSILDFELILVDDGSTDDSGKICDKYAIRDKRIKVIHKKNEGVGKARNTGIDIATGKFIIFIDADDFVGEDYLKNFFIFPIDKESVFIRQNEIWDFGEKKYPAEAISENKILNKENISEEIEKYKFSLRGAPWGKMFSLDLIKKYNLRFPIDINFREDHCFVLRYLTNCAKEDGIFIYIKDSQYHYVQHNFMSLIKRIRPTTEECMIFRNLKNAMDENIEYFKYSDNYIKEMHTSCFNSLVSAILQASHINDFKSIYNTFIDCKVKEMKLYRPKDKIVIFILSYFPKNMFYFNIKLLKKMLSFIMVYHKR